MELDVTNEELADAANITRFSASRLLNEWERKGVLTKSRNKIVLHSSERLFAHTLPRRGTAA
jgi:CRP/FNR family transcriptional regulator, nitrogen oxide reductase regulator